MITITNVRNFKKESYDEVWAVVRSMKKPIPGITKQVTELSPSWSLFGEYRSLQSVGNWNIRTFQKLYVPKFLREMHRPEAEAALKELVEKSNAGKHIALICYCSRQELCHTSILAGILTWVTEVKGMKKDYSDYGKAYMAVIEPKQKNTRITYLYRDSCNFKTINTAVVKGIFTKEQIEEIMGCLKDGEYFIPGQVGLDEQRNWDYDTDIDHPWFELDRNSFEETEADADSGLTVTELLNHFRKSKGNWNEQAAIEQLKQNRGK